MSDDNSSRRAGWRLLWQYECAAIRFAGRESSDELKAHMKVALAATVAGLVVGAVVGVFSDMSGGGALRAAKGTGGALALEAATAGVLFLFNLVTAPAKMLAADERTISELRRRVAELSAPSPPAGETDAVSPISVAEILEAVHDSPPSQRPTKERELIGRIAQYVGSPLNISGRGEEGNVVYFKEGGVEVNALCGSVRTIDALFPWRMDRMRVGVEGRIHSFPHGGVYLAPAWVTAAEKVIWSPESDGWLQPGLSWETCELRHEDGRTFAGLRIRATGEVPLDQPISILVLFTEAPANGLDIWRLMTADGEDVTGKGKYHWIRQDEETELRISEPRLLRGDALELRYVSSVAASPPPQRVLWR